MTFQHDLSECLTNYIAFTWPKLHVTKEIVKTAGTALTISAARNHQILVILIINNKLLLYIPYNPRRQRYMSNHAATLDLHDSNSLIQLDNWIIKQIDDFNYWQTQIHPN